MDKINQHAKHPKASMVLGCCTLCWGVAAAFFIFSGGIAVFNLTVEDYYFSAPQKCGDEPAFPHTFKERCNEHPGSLRLAKSSNLIFSTFLSTADEYARLTRNESWEVCYGFDENKMKPQEDADGCSINRNPAPKCVSDDARGVDEKWGVLKKYDPSDIESLLARQQDVYRKLWKNDSIAEFSYRPTTYATVGNAVFTLHSIFAGLAGAIALVSTFSLTDTRKLLLVIMLFTLTTSTYNLYNSSSYLNIQIYRNRFRNCAGLPNSTYYKTREIPECRVMTPLKSYVPNSFLSATQYEQYKYRCDLLKTEDQCNRFSTYCRWYSSKLDAQDSTDTLRARGSIAKDTCANKLYDGVFSFACNENQKPYWKGPGRKCQQFSDQQLGVTVISDAPDSPCDNTDKWDRSNCLQKKNVKCTMNETMAVTCTNATHAKHLPECKYGKTADFVYDLDLAHDYKTATSDNHETVKGTWEPCSEDKTIYGNVTKASDAFYKVPRGCVTDNKGNNEDKYAGSFLARAAVLDWGISMVYVEALFLLLTILHAFYCTGTADTSSTDAPNTSQPPTANVEIGTAKPNPFGPGQ